MSAYGSVPYFNMEEDSCVFHMMGQPQETRHIVMRNEQAGYFQAGQYILALAPKPIRLFGAWWEKIRPLRHGSRCDTRSALSRDR